MPQAGPMAQSPFLGKRIGITGARGALGAALARCFRAAGAHVTGFTHGSTPPEHPEGPHRWVSWSCGEEASLDEDLAAIDVLILNHGINPQGGQSPDVINQALEINTLSSWRLMQRFEAISRASPQVSPKEAVSYTHLTLPTKQPV